MTSTVHSRAELELMCRRAAELAGADRDSARVLAFATLEAEARGRTAVGLAHLFDYLDGWSRGRISRGVPPDVRRAGDAVLVADCREGLAQLAFEHSVDQLEEAAHQHGIAMLSVTNSFTVGELGYYPHRLAARGLLTLAVANSPALMSIGGAVGPVLGTNPLAFGVPREGGRCVLVDQASSQTAYVNVRHAAAQERDIPSTWAIDESGQATTDPVAALRGALLPFGGYKGGNVALLVEMLAVLSGARWSSEAAPFDSGSRSPGVGMLVIALDPAVTDPTFIHRVDAFVDRLVSQWQVPVDHILDPPAANDIAVPPDLLTRLRAAANG